jgi:tetratricopeptide (TPR) repeat protein
MTMRILIVDDKLAAGKELRRYSQPGKAKRSAARGARFAKVSVSVSKSAAKSKRGAKHAPPCATIDLADQPEQAAIILDALGIALLNRGCQDGAKLIELARKTRLATVGEDHPSTAASNLSYARVLRERGEYVEAGTVADQALRINRKVFGEQSLPVAISLNEIGIVQLRQAQFAQAEASANAGLSILQKLGLTQTDPNTTRLLDARGRAETAQGNLKAASETYDRALQLDEAQLGTRNHPKYATHLANAGLTKAALGLRKEAMSAFRKTIDVYENSLKLEAHPNLIDAYANLGAVLRMPGATKAELAEAGECLAKVLEMSIAVRGSNHSLVGNDYANYARWQYATSQPKAAVAGFRKALAIYADNVDREELPADHWFVAEALTWKGRVLVEAFPGDRAANEEAEKALHQAIDLWSTNVFAGATGSGIARACLGRAIYTLRKGDPQACEHLCAGYAAISTTFPDKAFIERVADWAREQKCNCAPADCVDTRKTSR